MDDTKAATSGDRKAMYALGCRYEYGEGTEKDLTKALAWYGKAANAGSLPGMNRVGEIYRDGDAIAKDYDKAKLWFEKAAQAGSSDAMNNLGMLHSYQRGFEYTHNIMWGPKAIEVRMYAITAEMWRLTGTREENA